MKQLLRDIEELEKKNSDLQKKMSDEMREGLQVEEMDKRVQDAKNILSENKEINQTLMAEKKIKDQEVLSLKGVILGLHKTVE